MLSVEKIRAGYGAINVLWDVTIKFAAGEAVGIIGPNGAGKTTLLRAIMGLVPVTGGAIRLDGTGVAGLSPWSLVDRGVALVPEGRMVFGDMTVRDNLLAGAFRTKSRTRTRQNLEWVFDLLPKLSERSKQLAGSLSGGEAQMLALGRGLMQEPRILLIDEPSLGLAPIMVDEIFSIIQRLKADGRTIILVEQNTARTYALADRIYLMKAGKIALDTTPSKSTLADLQVQYFSAADAGV